MSDRKLAQTGLVLQVYVIQYILCESEDISDLDQVNNTKLSRGEICVANFIPPANGASLGSFLC